MEWQGWLVLAVIIAFLLVLAFELAPADLVMFTSLTFIWVVGIVPTDAYLKGFASSGLATVGALFVVVKGVDASGAVERFFRRILGRNCSVRSARARLCAALFVLSGLFNNTPLIAMIIPIICDWARARGLAPSLFLMPADFAVIMGGLLTMIGTSTNLQVNDFLRNKKLEPFGFLEPGYVGLPVGAVATCLTLLLCECKCFLPRDKGGLPREIRQRGAKLVTALELPAASPFHGRKVRDVLPECKVQSDSLLKIRRPLTSNSPPTTAPESEANLDKSKDRSVAALRRAVVAMLPARSARGSAEVAASEGAATSPPSSSAHLVGFEAAMHPAVLQDAGYTEIFPVSPGEIVQAGDILLLSLSHEEIIDTLNRKTLGDGKNVRASSIHASQIAESGSEFVEVVLGTGSPLVGQPISEGAQLFETHYKGSMVAFRPRGQIAAGATEPKGSQEEVPLAVAGEKADEENALAAALEGGSPAIPTSKSPAMLATGDTVMLRIPVGQELPVDDFLLVTRVGKVQPPIRLYDYVPVVLFVAGLCLAASSTADMLMIAILLLLVFVAGGWVTTADYAKVIDWRLLILIGASTGLSEAMSRSGLSAELAKLLQSGVLPRWAILPALFTVMVVITEIVTNNAAVALGLPIAVDLAKAMKLKSHKPLTMAVLLGASVGFAMPMGYATHLMVYAPGGYSVKDFIKLGLVVDIIWIIGISLLMPVVYPL